MKQLRVEDIFNLVNKLTKKGMNFQDVMDLKIYIGDDDELNGIHTSWFCNLVDKNNEEDSFFIEMIEENSGNVEMEEKAILIS